MIFFKSTFISKSFGSYLLFKEQLQELCDQIFLCVVKMSGKKLKVSDAFFNLFLYEYVRYECVHFGKPNNTVTNNSRPNQKTNKIGCTFYFRLVFNENEKCMKIAIYFIIIL